MSAMHLGPQKCLGESLDLLGDQGLRSTGAAARTIRAKYAAVPLQWLEYRPAPTAFVKNQTSIGGNTFDMRVGALGAGQGCFHIWN
jgi:hypothetical protein